MEQHLRIARPARDLDRTIAMYRDGLGLELLGSFHDHEGFDGAMLGRRGLQYHFGGSPRTTLTGNCTGGRSKT